MKLLPMLLAFQAVRIWSKPLPDERLQQHPSNEFHTHLRERADGALLLALATGLEKRFRADGDEEKKTELEKCLGNAPSSSHYAQCVLSGWEGSEAKLRTKRQQGDNSRIRVEYNLESAMRNRDSEDVGSIASTADPIQSALVADFLTDILRRIKSATGPWHPDLSRSNPGGGRPLDATGSPNVNESIHRALELLMSSPMFVIKPPVDSDDREDRRDSVRSKRDTDDRLRFLSPRLFPLFDEPSAKVLSPDILSFFNSPNSVAALPDLFDSLRPMEREAWLNFVGELSGASDYLRWMQTDEFKRLMDLYQLQQQPYEPSHPPRPPLEVNLEPLEAVHNVSEFFESLNSAQWSELNERGYAFLEKPQMEIVYGSDVANDQRYWPFEISAYFDWSDGDRAANAIPIILESLMTHEEASPMRRRRQATNGTTTAGPTLAMPTILAPSIGPAYVNTIFLNAPTILSPSVFTPIINGPLVLSPYILSPYVFSPFITAPQVLTPFILNPFVLSPDILEPFVLSPNILSPTVFSPFILDPYVLSPQILSPGVGSPTILSPLVLSPLILSPSTLTATILSPGVLSPSILSDSDGPTILSPCALCKKKRRK